MSDSSRVHLSRLRTALRDIESAHQAASHEMFMLSSGDDADELARPTLDGLRGALIAYRDRSLATMESDVLHDETSARLIWRAAEVALAVIDPEYTPDPSIRPDVLDVASRF